MKKNIDLSVIIPVYNEEKRLPNSFKKIDKFFESKKLKIEYVFVNDGSSDNTSKIVEKLKFKTKFKIINVNLETNKGKGFALKKGVDAATGKIIMFTDADLSTPIDEYNKLYPYLKNYDIVIGSRRLKDSDIKISQPLHRKVLGFVFYTIFSIFFKSPVKDTNCGFKVYKKDVAKKLYKKIKNNRWGFDAEVIYLATKYKYKIKEVPVIWLNDPFSRVSSLKASFYTLWELFKIKVNNLVGVYDLEDENVTFISAVNKNIFEKIIKVVFSLFFLLIGDPIKNNKIAQKSIDLYEEKSFVKFFNKIRFWVAPIELIAAQITKKGKIIDLGCGDGFLVNYLATESKQRKIIGIDINPDRLKQAYKGLENTQFLNSNILNENLKKIDNILLIHVLHHLPSKNDQIKMLNKIYKALGKNGKIVIVEIDRKPFFKYVLTWITDAIIVPILFEHKIFSRNFYYRNKNEWLQILEKIGFEVNEVKGASYKKPFSHILIVGVKK